LKNYKYQVLNFYYSLELTMFYNLLSISDFQRPLYKLMIGYCRFHMFLLLLYSKFSFNCLYS